MTPESLLCHLGLAPERCAYEHVAERVPKGVSGDRSNRSCPAHADRKASLSINSGDYVRTRWKCQAGCSKEDVRAALLALGIHESCLGTYGSPKRDIVPGLRVLGHDPAMVADVKRYNAILKLPRDLNGKLYIMCVQAISEGDGDLVPDPLLLLPVNADDFVELAKRAGIERRYRYELFKRWLKSAP